MIFTKPISLRQKLSRTDTETLSAEIGLPLRYPVPLWLKRTCWLGYSLCLYFAAPTNISSNMNVAGLCSSRLSAMMPNEPAPYVLSSNSPTCSPLMYSV